MSTSGTSLETVGHTGLRFRVRPENVILQKMDYRISNLKNCVEFIPLLAKWFEEGFSVEGCCADEEQRWLQRSLITDSVLPVTFVAFDGLEPIGTARIFLNEIPDRPHYNPWFGYSYVAPSYRNHGVAKALYLARLNYCLDHDIKEVFLYTAEQESRFQRRGWKTKEERLWLGQNVKIMNKKISASDSNRVDFAR